MNYATWINVVVQMMRKPCVLFQTVNVFGLTPRRIADAGRSVTNWRGTAVCVDVTIPRHLPSTLSR